jgi:hypothetical protein
MPSGGVISYDSGDITITHSAGALSFGGGYFNFQNSDNASLPAVYVGNQNDAASVLIGVFEGNRATPTDGDVGTIEYRMSDSGGTQTAFVRQKITAVDVTDATEDGSTTWGIMKAGTVTDVVGIDATGLTYSNGASSNAYQLLGTITTTSGATQTLGSLILTNFKFVRMVFNAVSHNDGSNRYLTLDGIRISPQEGAGDTFKGIVDIDLTTGIAVATLGVTSGSTTTVYVADTAYTTATTDIVVGVSAGAFDAGEVKVYGI